MPKSLEDKLNALPPERQAKIKARYQALKKEYLTLQDIRKQLHITQQQLAEKLGTHQVNVSNIEKRTDLKLSTLYDYVAALGGKLHLSVEINGHNVELTGLGDFQTA